MQVEPLKSRLKPPETMRLKPQCDNLLLHFAFKFNLRRYSEAGFDSSQPTVWLLEGLLPYIARERMTKVGRCRFNR